MTEQLRSIRRKVIVEKEKLKREIGTAALFSSAYGNVGSSIYYALGATAVYALGATPLAIAVAGIFFVLTVWTFAEGTTMMPFAGGASVFTRKAFNESTSFFTGWIDLLTYIATISISSITAAYYAAHFFPFLKYPILISIGSHSFWTSPNIMTILMATVFIGILMVINILGAKEATAVNIMFTILDLFTQALLIILGFMLVLNIDKIVSYASMGNLYWPDFKNFIFGFAIAMVAYTGIDTISQMAEEAKDYKKTIPKAYNWLIIAVLVMSVGMPAVAFSVMTPPVLVGDWQKDPVAGIAHFMPDLILFGSTIDLSAILAPWVAFLAITILLIATNAGIIGSSRLAYSMGEHKQLPSFIFKLHRKLNTPYIAIIIFSIIAVLLLFVGIINKDIFIVLANLYSFGAVLTFAMAHIAIVFLRINHAELERPYKMPGNIKIKGKEIPVFAVIGFIINTIIGVMLFAGNLWTRILGSIWIVGGFAVYIGYRLMKKLPVNEVITIERVAETAYMPVIFDGIIVPTTGDLQAEMIQAACKIALKDNSRVIAMYVIEVPMTLPLTASIPGEKEKAEKAMDQAEIIGKEYGVQVYTKIVQTRSAGKAIVDEATATRANLIMLGTGEKHRSVDILSGRTVNFVAKNAPCAVWTNIAEKA